MELVGSTDNSEELMDLTLLYKPDVIVMDYELSVVSGDKLIKRIKKIAPDAGILITIRDNNIQSYLEASSSINIQKTKC